MSKWVKKYHFSHIILFKNFILGQAGLFNGAIGKLNFISDERNSEGFPRFVMYKPEMFFGEYYIGREQLNEIPLVPTTFPVYDPIEKVTSFPLILAYGDTIHRSQGLKLKRVSLRSAKFQRSSDICGFFLTGGSFFSSCSTQR